ncbi:MAG: aminopeptidase P family protein [Chloracidobacterium sp.]|uniref:Xaa-Pro aminopeptidase n=1 Tax=Chloracidobacterium validum TaxID=2821543 RepID=A0ABX8B706_9BACT|nr:aminopeptidase P family protein [Chloracidobacterium validum]QUW02703.1 aminopeptidase P family protein [Chloracidobacterium validum]
MPRALAVVFLSIWLLCGWPVQHATELASRATRPTPMLAEQPLADFKARRTQLQKQLADGMVLVPGRIEESQGVSEKFFQDENFFYLTGIEAQGATLLLTPTPYQGAREILFLPRRNPQAERWTGPQPGPDREAETLFGVEKALPADTLAQVLRELGSSDFFKDGGTIHLVANPDELRERPVRQLVELLGRNVPALRINDARSAVSLMRMCKTPAELALLKKAIRITDEAFRDIPKHLTVGCYEYEIEAVVLAAFYRNGAERPGYPCIIGAGQNATILHYNRNRDQIKDGDLVVVDVGAQYRGYTADITRTFPASGKFTARQRALYEVVLAAQEAAVKAFTPGKSRMSDLNLAARERMRSSPLRAGNGLTLDNFFIHGLGHFIGLNVHDVGDYARPLPPGSVITIEPGIYIPSERIGIRIEDDYLVTETGLVKLSGALPSSPEAIEQAMQEARRSPARTSTTRTSETRD